MLFDPFEEQFDLPAMRRAGRRSAGQGKVVRQKDEASFLVGIEELNASQSVGKPRLDWIVRVMI